MFDNFTKKLKEKWLVANPDHEELPKQKIIVVGIAVVLAFLIWLVVSLNRSYTVDVNVPLQLGKISTDKALVEEIPKNVTVRLSGEGWNLLSIFQNPAPIFVEVSGEQINLFDQVRRQMQSNSDVRVQSVDPLYLSLKLQERAFKTVPIEPRVDIDFSSQYGLLHKATLQPDSVMVSGARAVIDDIKFWPTDSLTLQNVDESISTEIPLKETRSLVKLSTNDIQFAADVVKFTEGIVTVPVKLQSVSQLKNVIFTPNNVKITYLTPIKKFPELNEENLFTAYVTYAQLLNDTTGYVVPKIEKVAEDVPVKIQLIQPRQVAYFNIVEAVGDGS